MSKYESSLIYDDYFLYIEIWIVDRLAVQYLGKHHYLQDGGSILRGEPNLTTPEGRASEIG